MYKPCGFYVLVELDDVEVKTDWGFVTAVGDEARREKSGANHGKVVGFGPTAFKGFAGCQSPDDWGVYVGDRVTFEKYAGTYPDVDNFPRLVTIPDNAIRAVKNDE